MTRRGTRERRARPMTGTVHRRLLLAGLAAGALAPLAATLPAAARDGPRKVIEVRIENRKVVAPTPAIRVFERDEIELRWISDEAVEIHLHGYDKLLRVRPGEPATMRLSARATGRFPLTSHGWGAHGHGHDALTYLEVYPR